MGSFCKETDITDTEKMSPGERLGIALAHVRLSQTELAKECGVSPQYVNNMLRRGQRITQDFAQYLALKIGINLNWLFTGDGPIFQKDYLACGPMQKSSLDTVQKHIKDAADNLYRAAELLAEATR